MASQREMIASTPMIIPILIGRLRLTLSAISPAISAAPSCAYCHGQLWRSLQLQKTFDLPSLVSLQLIQLGHSSVLLRISIQKVQLTYKSLASLATH